MDRVVVYRNSGVTIASHLALNLIKTVDNKSTTKTPLAFRTRVTCRIKNWPIFQGGPSNTYLRNLVKIGWAVFEISVDEYRDTGFYIYVYVLYWVVQFALYVDPKI